MANWIRKSPWSRKWKTTPVFSSERFHGQRSLVGYSPWDGKVADTLCNWACTDTHTHKANINLSLACIRGYIIGKESLNIKKRKQLILLFKLQVFHIFIMELAKYFCKRWDNEYFRFYRSYSLRNNYSTLQIQH